MWSLIPNLGAHHEKFLSNRLQFTLKGMKLLAGRSRIIRNNYRPFFSPVLARGPVPSSYATFLQETKSSQTQGALGGSVCESFFDWCHIILAHCILSVFAIVPSCFRFHFIYEKPHALVVRRIHPEHLLKDALSLVIALKTPEA